MYIELEKNYEVLIVIRFTAIKISLHVNDMQIHHNRNVM